MDLKCSACNEDIASFPQKVLPVLIHGSLHSSADRHRRREDTTGRTDGSLSTRPGPVDPQQVHHVRLPHTAVPLRQAAADATVAEDDQLEHNRRTVLPQDDRKHPHRTVAH